MARELVVGLAFSGALAALAACGSSSDGGTATPTEDGGSEAGSSGSSGIDAGPPPGVGMRFVAVGDTGTGNSDQQKVANAIAQKCAADGCAFVQLLGDNMYENGVKSVDDPQFQEKFETPFAAIPHDFFVVLGNHDYGGNGDGTEFQKGQFEVDYTAKSTKWKLPSAYYHHVKGDMELFGLDTNMQLFGKDAEQRADVAKWIAASTTPWKIAFGHHPYLSNGPHGNAGSYDGVANAPGNGANVKSFMDDVVCGKVDLYVSGHDHSRQWMNESCKGTELAVSGAGAKQTGFLGKNPTLFQSMELGFLYVIVEPNKLTCQFVDENGNVEASHEIVK